MVTFDDIEVGDVLRSGGYPVTRDEIVEFAGRYDPRPFHLDEAAGEGSVFGGLVASGIHTIAVWNRLRLDAEGGLVEQARPWRDALSPVAPRPGRRGGHDPAGGPPPRGRGQGCTHGLSCRRL